MIRPWYASREDVMSALDVAESARSVAQIDRLIEASSRSVEQLCHRRFYPERATRYLDWPSNQLGTGYRVYLDGAHELISVEDITAGGTAITDYFLEPQGVGPPYTRIEVDLGSGTYWTADTTAQRAIAITGVFGACADTELRGTLAEALDATETGVDGSGMAVGVGDLILVDDEYMQVTGRAQLATGATLAADLAQSPAAATFTLAGSFAFAVGEVITVDGERMLVTDAYDSTIVVERKWSGSVLAAHSSGATVRAPRTLTVTRAALGATADAHPDGSAVYRHVPPSLVRQLVVAETLVALAREQSGYSRTVGADGADRAASGGDLNDLREQVYTAHGRKVRKGAI